MSAAVDETTVVVTEIKKVNKFVAITHQARDPTSINAAIMHSARDSKSIVVMSRFTQKSITPGNVTSNHSIESLYLL